ncbi:MAG: acylneuraminate cytidylyltransferase family protein [Candidatus Pacebacteria bacterium]|nr:acylneuraminate cytidylyltransferase family protein [Candidatus Paceibacterota bacterium]
MSRKYNVLAVIPARGGSKAVPRKNIKKLCGKPLIYYMLSAALQSTMINCVAVSSEDDEILDIANRYGKASDKFTLIKRPKSLARDTTPTLPVVQHAIKKLEKESKKEFDFVVLLHAVSPMTTSRDIDSVIRKLIRTKADSVVSVYEVEGGMHPIKMKGIRDDRLYQYIPSLLERSFRRQDFPPFYKRAGGIYAVTRELAITGDFSLGFFCGANTRPYIMPKERAIDIDDWIDFEIARLLMKKYGN